MSNNAGGWNQDVAMDTFTVSGGSTAVPTSPGNMSNPPPYGPKITDQAPPNYSDVQNHQVVYPAGPPTYSPTGVPPYPYGTSVPTAQQQYVYPGGQPGYGQAYGPPVIIAPTVDPGTRRVARNILCVRVVIAVISVIIFIIISVSIGVTMGRY